VDVEDVLRAGGFTRFHRHAVVVTGAAWSFVAMEILLIAFALPVLGATWDLSATWLGWLGSSALAGALVGSLVLGRASDRIGRRYIFQLAILWYAAFTLLSAFSWGPESFFALRFLAGVGLGGMLVVDPSLLAEYLPPQKRGRFLVFLDFFWPIGFLVAIGLSWVFLVQLDGAWRWLFAAAAFPAFLAYVARRTLPESPYFLTRKGRTDEAAEVLTTITDTPVSTEGLAVAPEPHSSLRAFARPGLRRTSALILAVWIALNISYYGLFIWLPGVLAIAELGIDPYLLLTLIALAQFPGYAAALWLVEVWGRKPTLATFLVLGGVSALVFAVADSSPVYAGALFFVGFFNLGAWGAVYAYTPELFPTRLRSSAFGLVEGVGKGAAISGPYLFGFLLDATGATLWSLAFVAAVMATGGVLTLLARETRGQKLT
jgi:putative MFS transporter